MPEAKAPSVADGKQWRVVLSLDGNGLSTLEQTFRELVEVLRSGDELMPEFRDALAGAFERGQIGAPGVQAVIKGEAGFFKALGTVASDRRLLDAGRHIQTERSKGRSFESVYRDFTDMFGVVDVRDFGLRARRLFEEFRAFCRKNDREIRQMGGLDQAPEYCENDDDYYHFARAVFTEHKTGLHEKWPAGS